MKMTIERPIYGLEEEVFVTEPTKPSLKSLYYLAGMLKKNPVFYYTHTASNFSRGKDISQGLMSGVEISTAVHGSIDELMDDLAFRRNDLIATCDGLIVPLGHLINFYAPTNTCAFQIHVGGVKNREKAYRNLAYFLPLLVLLTVNSPGADGKYYGQSFRIDKSFAIGELRSDWEYRFQDIIYAKRLSTIELRIFDPIWDLDRIRLLLSLIDAIVKAEKVYSFNENSYNKLRSKVALTGYCEEIEAIYQDLNEIKEVRKGIFQNTCSDLVWEFYQQEGLISTYSALDNAYRTGMFTPSRTPSESDSLLKAGIGFAGYYVPKLPYVLWKYWREW